MRRTLYMLIICSILCGILAAGCGKRGSNVLARVDRETITLEQFEDRISKLPAHYQDVVRKNKQVFLDEIIVDTLLYKKAKRNRLDKDKEVTEVIDEARKKIMIARLLKDEVSDKIQISDGEIEDFYNANKEQFMNPEILRASHILVKTEGEANKILAELANNRDFAELARLYSIDPTAKNGGDVGGFKQGDLIPAFEEACFKLKVGQVSEIVKTRFGYHIIKLTDRKKPSLKKLEDLKKSIRDILRQRKRKELFNNLVRKLKEEAKIEINEGLLEEKED